VPWAFLPAAYCLLPAHFLTVLSQKTCPRERQWAILPAGIPTSSSRLGTTGQEDRIVFPVGFGVPPGARDVAASTLGPETRLRALRGAEGVCFGATRFGTKESR
jgi:hypothetical protein